MGKKIEDAEVKKECPSCGLGVALDSTICEFCGWDFEEEDEWILQIEKLERELMLEKQRFEPGSVNHKIESTLHTPHAERPEKSMSSESPAEEAKAAPIPRPAPSSPAQAEPPARQAKPVEVKPQRVAAPAPKPAPAAPERMVEAMKPVSEPVEPAPAARRAKSAPTAGVAEPEQKTRKVRVVRKVKQ